MSVVGEACVRVTCGGCRERPPVSCAAASARLELREAVTAPARAVGPAGAEACVALVLASCVSRPVGSRDVAVRRRRGGRRARAVVARRAVAGAECSGKREARAALVMCSGAREGRAARGRDRTCVCDCWVSRCACCFRRRAVCSYHVRWEPQCCCVALTRRALRVRRRGEASGRRCHVRGERETWAAEGRHRTTGVCCRTGRCWRLARAVVVSL